MCVLNIDSGKLDDIALIRGNSSREFTDSSCGIHRLVYMEFSALVISGFLFPVLLLILAIAFLQPVDWSPTI